MSLFTHQVTIRDRVLDGEDEYGNDVYTTVERTSPAWWEPRTSGEQTDARVQVTSGYWVYLPDGEPLTASSQVELYGAWYEVEGEPGWQPGGFTVDGFVKAAVTLVTG
jgi:hypothetical protein